MIGAEDTPWSDGALYLGRIAHQRLGNAPQRFAYRSVAILVDLAALPALEDRLAWFGYRRRAPVALRPADHGDGGDLAGWVARQLGDAGFPPPGRVRLLCLPRLLGHVFNPLSIYWCHDAQDRLMAVIYEVHNSFGERHAYVLPADPNQRSQRHICAKDFRVSPFQPNRGSYRFHLQAPEARFGLRLRYQLQGADQLVATYVARRRPLTDRNLAAACLTQPLLTRKIWAGIHWQALKLWWRGAPLQFGG